MEHHPAGPGNENSSWRIPWGSWPGPVPPRWPWRIPVPTTWWWSHLEGKLLLEHELELAVDLHRQAGQLLRGLSDRCGSFPTHGDWYPRNWLIHEDRLKVIDFGHFAWRPGDTHKVTGSSDALAPTQRTPSSPAMAPTPGAGAPGGSTCFESPLARRCGGIRSVTSPLNVTGLPDAPRGSGAVRLTAGETGAATVAEPLSESEGVGTNVRSRRHRFREPPCRNARLCGLRGFLLPRR